VGGDFSQVTEVLTQIREIVGEDADEEELIRLIRAADFDLNRALNFFWGA